MLTSNRGRGFGLLLPPSPTLPSPLMPPLIPPLVPLLMLLLLALKCKGSQRHSRFPGGRGIDLLLLQQLPPYMLPPPPPPPPPPPLPQMWLGFVRIPRQGPCCIPHPCRGSHRTHPRPQTGVQRCRKKQQGSPQAHGHLAAAGAVY